MASSSNGLATAGRSIDVIGVAGALLGALATAFLPFVELRPNRILSGTNVLSTELGGGVGWILLAGWTVLFVLAFVPPGRSAAFVRGLLVNVVAAGTVFAAANAASAHTLAEGDIARVTLGAAFWLGLLGCYVAGFAAMQHLDSRADRVIVTLLGAVAVLAMLATGTLDSLGIMREYLRDESGFWLAVRQQLFYTLGATGAALALGLALGVLAARKPRAEPTVFGVLNVLQVLPTLSFVGLLIVPFAWLGSNVALFDVIGVSGIGWAPVFVVLTAYALFPITRNTHSAMRTLDTGVIDAARGIGMRGWQRLLQVELPLAFPVVLAGVRIAAVQTTAGAIIAGLVGGGGLGRIVFYGLQQTALDLMLLGIIPIVTLALSFDIALRALAAMSTATQPGGEPKTTGQVVAA